MVIIVHVQLCFGSSVQLLYPCRLLINNKMATLTPKMAARLAPADRQAVAAVLIDCVDQLAILGGIMPSCSKPSAVDAVSCCVYLATSSLASNVVLQVMGDELKQILDSQRQLEVQVDGLGLDGGRLRDQAHSINATAQGRKHTCAADHSYTCCSCYDV